MDQPVVVTLEELDEWIAKLKKAGGIILPPIKLIPVVVQPKLKS